MPKNTTGGSYAKKAGSKHVNKPLTTRVVKADVSSGETYGQVIKMLGNNLCHMITHDNKLIEGHIRGKMTGRNKSANLITIGAIVRIGIWDLGSSSTEKKCKVSGWEHQPKLRADILEVYSSDEFRQLQTEDYVYDWNQMQRYYNLATGDNLGSAIGADNTDFDFANTTDDNVGSSVMPSLNEFKQAHKIASATTTETATAPMNAINVDDI